jgi:predicted RNA methylase
MKVMFDIGCNTGSNSDYYVNNNYQVFAFEPTPKLFNDIFLLCLNNYSIMVGDSLKIEESKKEVINIEKLRWYIQLVRGNLEHRSKIKNNLEQL